MSGEYGALIRVLEFNADYNHDPIAGRAVVALTVQRSRIAELEAELASVRDARTVLEDAAKSRNWLATAATIRGYLGRTAAHTPHDEVSTTS